MHLLGLELIVDLSLSKQVYPKLFLLYYEYVCFYLAFCYYSQMICIINIICLGSLLAYIVKI